MMRKSDIWLTLGWIAMTGSIALFMVLPHARQRQQLVGDVLRLRTELNAPDQAPELIREIEASLEVLEEFRAGRVTKIPEESDVAGLMQSISRTLSELRLDQRDITTNRPKALEYASSLPVSVTLTGSFPRIFRALEKIETLPRLIRVDRLKISAPTSGNGSIDRTGEVRAEMSVSTFFAPRSVADVTPGEGGM